MYQVKPTEEQKELVFTHLVYRRADCLSFISSNSCLRHFDTNMSIKFGLREITFVKGKVLPRYCGIGEAHKYVF